MARVTTWAVIRW